MNKASKNNLKKAETKPESKTKFENAAIVIEYGSGYN